MAAPVPLREDYDGPALRALAKASKDAKQTRRLLALAVIYDGGRRREAATTGGVGLQVIRDWVVERTFAWLGRCRRLAKDWETSISTAQAWLLIASIRNLARRIARAITTQSSDSETKAQIALYCIHACC